MELSTIFTIVLLLSASALCIAFIIYFYRITKSVERIEGQFKQISADIKPLIKSTEELTQKLGSVASELENQVGTTKKIISDVKDHVNKILELEEKIRGGFEEPVTSLVKNLSAISNGVNTFWKTYKER